MKEKSKTEHICEQFHAMIQKINSKPTFKFSKLTMLQISLKIALAHISSPMALSNKVHALTHRNKMVLLNGKTHHILKVAQSLMFQTSVPKKFFGEAVLTSTYLINRIPSRPHTPYKFS